VDDDDDYGSPFFLSYAHVTDGSAGAGEALDPDGLFSKFFHDLAGNVVHLIRPRADVPAGFMDRGMRGGMDWTDELLHPSAHVRSSSLCCLPRTWKANGAGWNGMRSRCERCEGWWAPRPRPARAALSR